MPTTEAESTEVASDKLVYYTSKNAQWTLIAKARSGVGSAGATPRTKPFLSSRNTFGEDMASRTPSWLKIYVIAWCSNAT